MRKLDTPRPIPEGAVLVPIPGKGEHALLPLRQDRMPALARLVQDARDVPHDPMDGNPQMAAQCGAVGLMWAHPELALETPTPPLRGLNAEGLVAYGYGVAEEFYAAGYDVTSDIPCMYLTTAEELGKRSKAHLAAFDEVEIKERVAFFSAVVRKGSPTS